MKAPVFLMHALGCAALLAAAGCNRDMADASSGMRQTKFPGMVTAGGGTSGDHLGSNNKPVAEGTYAGGTPGIAGGSGGTSGGAATPGTFQETGHGPSQGTTQPSSLGRPGAHLNPGEHPQPATPGPGAVQGGSAVQRESPAPAAPGR